MVQSSYYTYKHALYIFVHEYRAYVPWATSVIIWKGCPGGGLLFAWKIVCKINRKAHYYVIDETEERHKCFNFLTDCVVSRIKFYYRINNDINRDIIANRYLLQYTKTIIAHWRTTITSHDGCDFRARIAIKQYSTYLSVTTMLNGYSRGYCSCYQNIRYNSVIIIVRYALHDVAHLIRTVLYGHRGHLLLRMCDGFGIRGPFIQLLFFPW